MLEEKFNRKEEKFMKEYEKMLSEKNQEIMNLSHLLS
jgi:hypothetical protein